MTILASDLSLGLEWTLNVVHYFFLKLKLKKKKSDLKYLCSLGNFA